MWADCIEAVLTRANFRVLLRSTVGAGQFTDSCDALLATAGNLWEAKT